MRPSQSSLAIVRVAVLVLAVVILAGSAFATAEKVAYSFLGTPDGLSPQASLVADSAGNLYGTTLYGGTGVAGPGIVFELSPPATSGGVWTETILHNFDNPDTTGDGASPYGTLLLDKQGNLYGTTELGGAYGAGAIFEVSPPATPGGDWTEVVLLSFQQSSTAARPYGKLVMDAEGNLYGTTSLGGTDHNAGAVFELVAPKTAGEHWSASVLYNLDPVYGATPGPDILLRNGVIYGTTQIGGSSGNGTVYQLARKAGVWTATFLHSFSGSDGMLPYGGLIADSAGNLYGTTVNGGDTTDCAPLGCGTVYELSPPATPGDPWQLTTLHIFTKNGDGANPWGALWRDKLGNLYGTAYAGGTSSGKGTIFKLQPPTVAGGAWTFVVLHSFSGLPSDGANPHGGLILLNGGLYGTTVNGGKKYLTHKSGGTVFSVVR
jgi:uncharacterized repeat protein (TIGR03803 family)